MNQLKCKHEDGYSRTKYSGQQFISGVFYCRDCGHATGTKKI